MFYLLSFLGDSAQAMLTIMTTAKMKPIQSVKESRRKSNMSKESVPSNNRASAARINKRTAFFKTGPNARRDEPQLSRVDLPAHTVEWSSQDSWYEDNYFVPLQN